MRYQGSGFWHEKKKIEIYPSGGSPTNSWQGRGLNLE